MLINIVTIFPEIFSSYFNESILKRAQDKNLLTIKSHDLRAFAHDKHQTVDDTPYGGGAGMLLKIEPIYEALQSLTKPKPLARLKQIFKKPKRKIVLLSAKGQTWTQKLAQEYSQLDELILICGRYEGVDDRILHFIDEEISIGDYVLTGGELGAMVMVDSIARLLPGVLGNEVSHQDESHSEAGVLEYPHYTKPPVFKAGKEELAVPEVLLSGNHQAINDWRQSQRKAKK
jgi:tRNA (guanine37-N1)-methyltransferase